MAIDSRMGPIFLSLLLSTATALLSQATTPSPPATGPENKQQPPPFSVFFPGGPAVPEMTRHTLVTPDGRGLFQAAADVELRKAPPKGWLKLPGEERGVVKSGEIVAVLEQRTVSTLFASQQWLKIRRFCEKGSDCSATPVWVYAGDSAEPLFRPASAAALNSTSVRSPALQGYLKDFQSAIDAMQQLSVHDKGIVQ